MIEEPKRCATCGRELTEGRCAHCANKAVSKIVRLDAARLLLLAAVSILCFIGTRAVAKIDRDTDRKQAATNYAKAVDALHAHDEKTAIQELRNATIHDAHEPKYALALAEALSDAGQDEESLQLLLRIRENIPEDPEINSQIARVEAKRGNAAEAELYYHHALYGIWQGEDAYARRRHIRLELIQFLNDHNRRNAALSELLALQSEAPKDPEIELQVAALELKLGEAKGAKTVYEQVLRSNKKNLAALTGMAEADYRLGQFAAAARTVHAIDAETATPPAEITRLKTLLDWIGQHDPTARGLSRVDRMDRMNLALNQALQHLTACRAAKTLGSSQLRQSQDMQGQLLAFQTKINGTLDLSLQDVLPDGFDLISRAEDLANVACPGSVADEALTTLAKAKGAGER